MKRLISILCAAALALSLAGCGAAGDAGGAAANDSYSLEDAVTFTFRDGGITAQGGSGGYEIDGTALTIDGAGAYVVTGSCADGSITVKKGTTGVVLALNGLSLSSGDTAPITCGKSSEVTILAVEGSENSLSDSEKNNDETYPDNEAAENAVIKCKDGAQVTLCGSGSLTITANGKNGIKSGASTTEGEALLVIRELALTIDAPVNDAINAEQTLLVESGTLTIGAEGTEGPVIDITACYEGLEAAELKVCSGDIHIVSLDDCLNAANSDLRGYDFTMEISGGTVTAYSSGGDGFDSNGSLTISGGSVAVWTANTTDNQPLDADGGITISGGTVLAAGGSSGMGMDLTAEQPCVIFGGSGGFGGQSGAAITKEAAVTIADSEGNAVYSGSGVCDARFVLLSSDELTAEESCTLQCGESTMTAQAQRGTVSSGFGPGGMMGGGQGGMTPPEGGGQPPEMPDGQQPPERPEGQRPQKS